MADSGDPRNAADPPDEDGSRSRSVIGSVVGRLSAVLRSWTGGTARQTIEEILDAPEEGPASLEPEERHMLRNILEFGDLRVGDIMVPRADIIAIAEDAELADLVRLFRDAQHSRLPVYRGTLDDALGMVHIKDVIGLLVPGEAQGLFSMSRLVRETLFVPPSMPVVDLLLKMQTTRIHLALVIDEYGGTEGLVSIEDIVEQIVGEIDDEHDDADVPMLVARPDGGFDADARADLEEVEQALGARLVPSAFEEEVDTLAGLVATLAKRVPKRGEVIHHPDGYGFEVLDADARRLKRIRIRLPAPAADTPEPSLETGKARVGGV